MTSTNRHATVGLFVAGTLALAGAAATQGLLDDKVAAAKASAAENQLALRNYTWIQATDVSYKGEPKKTTVDTCQYGPDGTVQKAQLSTSPPPEQKRGLRGRIAEHKMEEMKAEVQNAVALIHSYVPPSPDRIQAARAANNISLTTAGQGRVALVIKSYVKPGDSMTLTFEPLVQKLQQVAVSTYLDDPSKPVTLQVTMQTLPGGPSYPAVEVLALPSSNLSIKVQNTNYHKLGQ
jgi:hypothetical protein